MSLPALTDHVSSVVAPMRTYPVHRASPGLDASQGSDGWSAVDRLLVDRFHPASSSHRPVVTARLAYDDDGLTIGFHVCDRFVRSVRTRVQDRVSSDSCVEFFVQPVARAEAAGAAGGYFNFEVNCGGTMLVYFIEDPARSDSPGRIFRKYTVLPEDEVERLEVFHSMPRVVEPEVQTSVEWSVAWRVPRGLIERYAGPVGELSGQSWRGNFFKCADETSHPHWAAWSDIGAVRRFHQPERFGVLHFQP